jgi:hypothetical protein
MIMMPLFKDKKIIFSILLVGFFLASSVFALQVSWPNSPMGTKLTDESGLTDFVKYLYEWGIAIGGIATFVALVFGGFLYLTSAGDPGRLKEAKDRIFSAITGLALLLAIYLILNTINPDLTTLRPPSFTPPQPTTSTFPLLESQSKPKSCSYVRLYYQASWGGNSTTVDASDHPDKKDVRITKEGVPYTPLSVKFFQRCDPNEWCKCPPGTTTGCDLHYIVEGKDVTTTIECEYKKAPAPTIPGDVNGDCVVNQTDLNLCSPLVGKPWVSQDLDGDGKSDNCNWYPVDNPDGQIDVRDIAIIGKNLGKACLCYKPGGVCSLELYSESVSGFWIFITRDACGTKLGNTQNDTHNLKLVLSEDADINCVKLYTGI